MNKKTKFLVLCQPWTEYERGFGCRPDGYTLYLSKDHRDKHIKNYNKKNNNLDFAPDEYTKADGNAYFIIVDKKCYDDLVESKDVIWGHSNYPPPKATDAEILELSNQKNE